MKLIFILFLINAKKNALRVLKFAVLLPGTIVLCQAQRLEPSVLATAGGVIPAVEGGSLSWTLGEIIIDEIRDQGFLITQGFHQGDFKISTSFHSPEFLFDITVFPNPVHNKMQINTNCPGILDYLIYNAAGELLIQGKFSTGTELDAESWTDGFYLMAVKKEGYLISSIIFERIH